MPTYRVRSCPNCHYYLGFTVTRSSSKRGDAPVNGLCLNCGYKLPVHAVIRGSKRPAPSKQAPNPSPLALTKSRHKTAAKPEANLVSENTPSPSGRYAVDLRAIGQELETLQLNTFNLECAGASYLVSVRKESDESADSGLSQEKEGPLRILWKRIAGGELKRPKPPRAAPLRSQTVTYRYDAADIERIDRAGKARREPGSGITDGHSLSQLMRTLGALLTQKDQKLLAISWQEVSISVVVETSPGQRQLDLYRHDNLYDFWVKGYLRRASRAYSDVPS
jgi:hypothetical protein